METGFSVSTYSKYINMISLIFELWLILEIPETTVLAKMIMHICSANCTASRLSIAKKIEMSFIYSNNK